MAGEKLDSWTLIGRETILNNQGIGVENINFQDALGFRHWFLLVVCFGLMYGAVVYLHR